MMTAYSLKIGAVGDISFEGKKNDHPSLDCLQDVLPVFGQLDIVIGNLEGPLLKTGRPVLAKCTLRGSPEWAVILRSAGINVLSLSNNHIMDYGEHGLFETIKTLEDSGIRYVGAGRNRQEACAPLLMNHCGKRIAILARSTVEVGAPTYATDRAPGAAFFDKDETLESIRYWKQNADIVILVLHWGIEEHIYPSPSQRHLAKLCVQAGVDAILGHHPHVLQGIEYLQSVPIVYSLGNFAFNEFEWTFMAPGSGAVKYLSTLSGENRMGLIATLEWTRENKPHVDTTPVRINADGSILIDVSPERQMIITERSNRLKKQPYHLIWSMYAMHQEWKLRLSKRLSIWKLLKNVHRIRPQHFIELARLLKRSGRIVGQKSTNPYD